MAARGERSDFLSNSPAPAALISQTAAMSAPDRTQEFLELLTTHDRALGVYVHSLVQDVHDADDILQQTKMILWRCFEQFETGTNFLAWARKTAFHQI